MPEDSDGPMIIGYGELTLTDPVSGLKLETAEDIIRNPGATGELLAEKNRLAEAVLGAIEDRPDVDRERLTQEVMGGLVMEGSMEWRYIRFPKLHIALGRVVVGNKCYYTPRKPQE